MAPTDPRGSKHTDAEREARSAGFTDVTQDMAGLRARKESLEAEVRRISDAIAALGHIDSLLRAIGERENELCRAA